MQARDTSLPQPPAEGAIEKPARGNESYIALVWRRLKRSWTGMAGLWLVVLLLFMAVVAGFLGPIDAYGAGIGFAPPPLAGFAPKGA